MTVVGRPIHFSKILFLAPLWKRCGIVLLYSGIVLLPICLSCSSITGPEVAQDVIFDLAPDHYRVIGYHPSWMQDSWKSYDYNVLDQILFFDLSLNRDGTIKDRNGWPDRWEGLIDLAESNDVTLIPTLSILDSDTFLRLFEHPDHVAALRETLVNLVQETTVHGLHLDFEMYDPSTSYIRRAFTRFIHDLRSDLTGVQPELVLSLFALAFDEYDVYDEAALSEYLDFFIVQGYDLHWINDTQAGPIAPLDGWDRKNWNSIVQRFATLGIPKKKLVMGVPYYGYEWPTESEEIGSKTRGPGIITTFAPLISPDAPISAAERVEAFGNRRDVDSGSPYYVFRDSTGWYQGWYEDAESLSAKYDFVKQQSLGGIAIFPLGYGDETLAEAIRDAFWSASKWKFTDVHVSAFSGNESD